MIVWLEYKTNSCPSFKNNNFFITTTTNTIMGEVEKEVTIVNVPILKKDLQRLKEITREKANVNAVYAAVKYYLEKEGK